MKTILAGAISVLVMGAGIFYGCHEHGQRIIETQRNLIFREEDKNTYEALVQKFVELEKQRHEAIQDNLIAVANGQSKIDEAKKYGEDSWWAGYNQAVLDTFFKQPQIIIQKDGDSFGVWRKAASFESPLVAETVANPALLLKGKKRD